MTLRDCLPSWRITLDDELRDRLVTEALREGLGARYLWTRLSTLSEELIFAPPMTAGVYGGIVLTARAA